MSNQIPTRGQIRELLRIEVCRMSVYRLNRPFNLQSGSALDVAVDHGFFGERSF